MSFYHTYVENPFAAEDTFGARTRQPWPWQYVAELRGKPNPPPPVSASDWTDHADLVSRLPKLTWASRPGYEAAWAKTWEIAARNRRRATPANRFAADFLSTAFNGNTFMWDSSFIALFGRYAARAWSIQSTCDNFYAKQHPDGFICREISEADGEDRFQRFDPCATGPNILPWAEWESWLNTGDKARLARVFPPLAAFHQWMRRYRTWPDGMYWATGWSCGMDNQRRFDKSFTNHGKHDWFGVHEIYDHNHGSWIDTTFQSILSARLVVQMAEALGRGGEVEDFRREIRELTAQVNARCWDESTGFYHDLDRDGKRRSATKSVGAYWGLLAGAVPADRIDRLVRHLEDPKAFNRAHRVPSMSADSPGYEPGGDYWRGGVWAPTNYMVLNGLTRIGRHELAHEIGVNHLDNVVECLASTGTLWENYAPDIRGAHCTGHSTPDFVGWTGLVPTAVMLEFVLGLRPSAPEGKLLWDLRTTDAVSVERYPFGPKGTLHLKCHARASASAEPKVEIEGDVPVVVDLRWQGGRRELRIGGA